MSEKPSQNPTSSPGAGVPKDRRNALFGYLGHCIRLSHEKLNSKNSLDRTKLAWGRLMVSAIAVYGALLKDVELEDLEQRIERLEKGEVPCLTH